MASFAKSPQEPCLKYLNYRGSLSLLLIENLLHYHCTLATVISSESCPSVALSRGLEILYSSRPYLMPNAESRYHHDQKNAVFYARRHPILVRLQQEIEPQTVLCHKARVYREEFCRCYSPVGKYAC